MQAAINRNEVLQNTTVYWEEINTGICPTGMMKEEPHTNTKMSPSLPSITPALEAKKKTQQTSKSTNLQLTYLWQFKQYPLPLVQLPLKKASQLC